MLGSRDFRRLLAARVASQIADGLFLSAVLLTVVFLPEQQSTVRGFALATTLFLLPFSLLGPRSPWCLASARRPPWSWSPSYPFFGPR